MKIKAFIKENKLSVVLITLAAVLISVAAVFFKQNAFRVFPLYVSLVIGLLQAKANRYAPLVGGVNSVFYAAVNVYYGLYASAAYALIFSCPIQILTFIRWRKNAYGSSTVFKKMKLGLRISVLVCFLSAWMGLFFLLGRTDGKYVLLDSFSTILGIVTTFLTLFAFKEYTVTMLIGGVCTILIYSLMIRDGLYEQYTYLVYAVYTMICSIRGFIKVQKLYRLQNKTGGLK